MSDRLWQEHRKEPFPPTARGRLVGSIDLILLDADTAGCIQTFYTAGGALTIGHVAMLGRCYHDLVEVLPHLRPEERRYFHRLERIAGEVLTDLSHRGFEA